LSSTAHSSLHLNRHGDNNEKEKTGRLIIELAGSFHISDLPLAAARKRFNGLSGGTSPPELPNLGIAMKMDDAK
jgi:hypothetical protein